MTVKAWYPGGGEKERDALTTDYKYDGLCKRSLRSKTLLRVGLERIKLMTKKKKRREKKKGKKSDASNRLFAHTKS